MGRSTIVQLLKVYDKRTEILQSCDQVDMIYIDMKKAFNKVQNRRLMEKRRRYGIKGRFLRWMKGFLFEKL